jgi:plastocyanin
VNRQRIALLVVLALGCAAVIPSVAFGGGAHGAAGHTVILKDLRFHPGDITINRGDSVTWLWRDGEVAHNVTFHGFHSRTQSSGSYTVRFTRAGSYSYDCTIHVAEGMKGKIVVR